MNWLVNTYINAALRQYTFWNLLFWEYEMMKTSKETLVECSLKIKEAKIHFYLWNF